MTPVPIDTSASLENLQSAVQDMIMHTVPILGVLTAIMVFSTIFRSFVHVVHHTPSNTKPPQRTLPPPVKPKIDLTKAPVQQTPSPSSTTPEIVPLSLVEQVQRWNLSAADATWLQWEETLRFVTEHQRLLTTERDHLFSTLMNDVAHLVEAFQEIGEDERPNLLDEFVGSLLTATSKLQDIQEGIKQTKEFRFRQKAERIHHR